MCTEDECKEREEYEYRKRLGEFDDPDSEDYDIAHFQGDFI